MFKNIKYSLPLSLILVVLFLVSGCGKSTTTDQTAIESVITSDATYFGTDFFNDEKADTSTQSVETQAASASIPFLWFRIIDPNSVTKNITVTVGSASETAEATVNTTLSGTLKIEKSKGDTIVQKPFKDVFTRKAKFEKNALGIWEIKEITPLSIALAAGSGTQTVSVIKIFKKNSEGTYVPVLEGKPDQFYKVADIPTFSQSDEVKVEVTISNSSIITYLPQNFTFLHTWKSVLPRRYRMYDDGTNGGDSTANDLTFTITGSLDGFSKTTHYAIADVISAEVFENTADLNNYNAAGLGIHYVVQ